MKLAIRYGFCLFFGIGWGSLPVQGLWMCDDHVEPEGGLDLLHDVGEVHSRDALYWLCIGCERLEEAHYTLGDTCLLSLLMYISASWVEVHYLSVCVFLFFRLGGLWLQ